MTTTRRQRASAHAKRAHYCTCGRYVFGNGGKASHFTGRDGSPRMGHHEVSSSRWTELHGAAWEATGRPPGNKPGARR